MSLVKPSDGKTDLELRVGFLDLTAQDLSALRELRPVLEAHAANLVSAFYRHLLSFEPTRSLLADPDVKDRLLGKQREYLLSLCGPVLDEAYVLDRVCIGATHQQIGLEPRWYLGAYSLYFSLLLPLIRDAFQHDPERGERTTAAMMKLLMLDAQLAMEAYIERHDRKLEHLNRELAETSRSLARDLGDRSEELRRSGRRVQQAEALASVANLAAGLAHEIGTPMGVIQGHAEALEPSVADEKGRWRLRTIREQVDRVSRIIQSLLNMARPHETAHQPVALEPLLETTLSFLGVRLKHRNIEVARDYRPARSVLGDGEKLQQLFLNLAMNAADAMERDGGTLHVTLRPVDDDHVEVRFADTGAGIPADQLGRIFDPFFTTKPAGQGNGLGLVVAKGIASDHGGQIVVESEPGKGTTFTIRLPAAQGAEDRA